LTYEDLEINGKIALTPEWTSSKQGELSHRESLKFRNQAEGFTHSFTVPEL